MMFPWIFGGAWMIIGWIVIIGLIVWGVVTLTRRGGSRSESGANRTPLDIARERYAKGEITREEFERMKKDLT
jgi:putative membrane protein